MHVEWAICAECGIEFPRFKPRRRQCGRRCYMRVWRRAQSARPRVSGDRRPWLILSRSEALALQQAVLQAYPSRDGRSHLPTPLARALRVIDNQIRYIDGGADGLEPSQVEAVLREQGQWDA